MLIKKMINEKTIPAECPANNLEYLWKCPLCRSSDRINLYTSLTDVVFRSATGRWDLYKCQKCGVAYLDPRLKPESIGLAYKTYYTHEYVGHDTSVLSLRHIRRAFANSYRNYQLGAKLRPTIPFGYLLFSLFSNQKALLDAELRHIWSLPKNNYLKSKYRILDVGCGNGDFLNLGVKAGWSMVGIDSDLKAVALARSRGLDARVGTLSELLEAGEKFDGVTLSHVIEHVHDPRKTLQECRSLLRDNGWIWLETPNIESGGHRLLKSCWRGLEIPRHLFIFNRASLVQMLKDSGFSEIEVMPYRPLVRASMSESLSAMDHAFKEKKRPSIKRIIKKMEKEARENVDLREVITIRAFCQPQRQSPPGSLV